MRFVRVERDGGVSTIRWTGRSMKPLNSQLQEEIRAASIEVAPIPPSPRVVIYAASGVFAAGADVKENGRHELQRHVAARSNCTPASP